MYINKMHLEFDSKSANESFARVSVAAFVTQLDPTLEEIADIKTAVSEAVTNSIIHGYEEGPGVITIDCKICDRDVEIVVKDEGIGIEDIEKAREPLFTTKSYDERSGMGFVFMDVFMDSLEVISQLHKGTTVIMKKTLATTN
jgi:stage II sporulation protein AB (anti-sigma F factor)